MEAYFKHKADPKSGAEKLADSTLAMRRSVHDRAIAGELSKLKLAEVTPQRLKRLCDEVKEKRGPAVALHVREVVLLVFRHAQGSGLDVSNPAESIRTSAIATFEPRERALSPSEVRAVPPAELKALEDKARDLRSRKVQQLGELAISTGADALSVEELTGALIVLTETKDAGKREAWAKRGAAFFQGRSRRIPSAPNRNNDGAPTQPSGAQPPSGDAGAT